MAAGRSAHVRTQTHPGRFRERLIADADLHRYVVDFRRHILRQIIQRDGVYRRLGVSRAQHGFPLGITRRGNSGFRVLVEIHLLPGTPVAVGIVDVAAARQQVHIAGTAKLGPSPARENLGIKNIALIRAFALRTRAQEKNLSQVAAGGIEAAAGSLGKTSDLRGRGLQQVGKFILPVDGENMSAVSGAGEQFVMRIEREGINDILPRSPDTRWGTVGGNAVHIGTAAGAAARKRERTQPRSTGRRGENHPRG